MTNTTRKTQTARIEALESDVAEIKTGIAALLELAKQQTGPVTPEVTVQTVAGEVVSSEVVAPEGTAALRGGKNGNLAAFKALNPQFVGLSTKQIAVAIVKDGAEFTGPFHVGPRYAHFALHGEFPANEPKVVKATKAPAKASTKKAAAKKTEAPAPVVAPVVAQTEVEGPAYGSPEWIKATHPREKDTPRRADGKPTPKAEWPMRIALEATGKFDRFEVDNAVANLLNA